MIFIFKNSFLQSYKIFYSLKIDEWCLALSHRNSIKHTQIISSRILINYLASLNWIKKWLKMISYTLIFPNFIFWANFKMRHFGTSNSTQLFFRKMYKTTVLSITLRVKARKNYFRIDHFFKYAFNFQICRYWIIHFILKIWSKISHFGEMNFFYFAPNTFVKYLNQHFERILSKSFSFSFQILFYFQKKFRQT